MEFKEKLKLIFVGSVIKVIPTFNELLTIYLGFYMLSPKFSNEILQVAKHPFITPGPSTVFTPPPTRHSTLPGVAQGVLAGITMTGSLPHHYGNPYGNMTPLMGLKNSNGHDDVSSSGYPTPRPGSAASGFDSFYMGMGSPQIGASTASAVPGGPGQLFRSFPRPHSSPKMKLR